MTAFAVMVFDKLRGWLLAAVAVITVIGIAYTKGRRSGSTEATNAAAAAQAKIDLQAAEDSLNSVKERHDVEDEIARGPDGAAADRLRDGWSRD